jgi:6-pyruvoyltetrahydropterin/6-carboxytetrahydropterin synthase
MVSVTKRFDFCYAHQLPEYDGPCVRLHGHNSQVEVEVGKDYEGPQYQGYPGMVVDFKDLKGMLGEVLSQLDHEYLNEVLPREFLPPTAENIASWISSEVMLRLPLGLKLLRVRVSETPSSWAEWRP